MMRFLRLASLLLAGGLAGCSTSTPRGATIHLTATLTSPVDVELKWTDTAPGAAGYIVEWTPDLKSEYVVLGFLPPDATAYTHPALMPETTCHYRVRAFYGPASNPIDVRLPEELSNSAYWVRYEMPEDFEWAMPRKVPANPPVAQASIRDANTRADAAPTGFKAELVPTTVSGFQLTWTDRARDEEGYFLEMKTEESPAFQVRAVMEPNVNAFGYAFEPPMRNASFRVRPFYYGKPSNLVHLITGKAPENR
jgi:hypothetical protein